MPNPFKRSVTVALGVEARISSSSSSISSSTVLIDFFVNPETADPCAGEVSVGCSAMPQVQALVACNVLAACVFMS